MGRRPQPEIRGRLLTACTDHALAHGLPDRLEPLAEAAGVSSRVLLYHFGTRDGLLRSVLEQARRRQTDLYEGLLAPQPGVPYTTTLLHFWMSMTGPGGRPYLRMFGQLRESAEQQLWPGFRREATTDWLQPLERGLASIGRPELATLVLAVVRGLLMDLEATAGTARADQAFRHFLDGLDGSTTSGRRAARDTEKAVTGSTSRRSWPDRGSLAAVDRPYVES